MYLWNIKALTEDLKNDRVTEREKMKYYIFITASQTIPFYMPNDTASTNYVELIVALTLTLFGIYLCFEANARGDNKDFISRMVILSVPVFMRLLVSAIPVVILVIILSSFFGLNVEKFADNSSLLVILISYFWLYSLIKDVSGAKNKDSETQLKA